MRYYQTRLHRFLIEDPAGFGAGDTNLYAYVGNAPVDLSDPEGLSAVGDFSRGAASYFEGLYGTARYSARLSGVLGDCERQRAQREGVFLANALALYLERQEVRDLAADIARAYVRTHKARFAGRAATGTAITAGLSAAVGPPVGGALGGGLAFAAFNGNIRLGIERGARTLDDLIAAGVIGNAQRQPGGRYDSCR